MNRAVEKGVATRQNIVEVATRLFSASGYEATSTEAILNACGISRGALYHHFAGKEAIFEAVLETMEADIAAKTVQSVAGITDPALALRAGVNVYLTTTSDPKIRQIVLVDAPAVVGWHKWRAIDARFGFGLLKAGLALAAAQGRGRPDMVEINAHLLLASMMEIALFVSRAEDPGVALESSQKALGGIIDGMLASS